uniref:Uncharacterized protein n=1 Tax=Ananas comosus var. bracteatus TaxID=296719 RepID=A0A6V7QYN6_ANACO
MVEFWWSWGPIFIECRKLIKLDRISGAEGVVSGATYQHRNSSLLFVSLRFYFSFAEAPSAFSVRSEQEGRQAGLRLCCCCCCCCCTRGQIVSECCFWYSSMLLIKSRKEIAV